VVVLVVDHGHHLQIQEQWVHLTPTTQRPLVMLVLEDILRLKVAEVAVVPAVLVLSVVHLLPNQPQLVVKVVLVLEYQSQDHHPTHHP
jgi:hypothetical protein